MQLDIEQGSDIWLELRKTKITSTDAAIILGASPYKDEYELLNQKLGLSPPDKVNDFMKEGSRLEPIAREAYVKHTGRFMSPKVFLNDQYQWAMASLDGINFDGDRILEIKCGAGAFKRGEDIPRYYFAQIQHAMFVTNVAVCDYFVYWRGDFILVEIVRNNTFIERMIEKELTFYEELNRGHSNLSKMVFEKEDFLAL